jgi:hypothetical protein
VSDLGRKHAGPELLSRVFVHSSPWTARDRPRSPGAPPPDPRLNERARGREIPEKAHTDWTRIWEQVSSRPGACQRVAEYRGGWLTCGPASHPTKHFRPAARTTAVAMHRRMLDIVRVEAATDLSFEKAESPRERSTARGFGQAPPRKNRRSPRQPTSRTRNCIRASMLAREPSAL